MKLVVDIPGFIYVVGLQIQNLKAALVSRFVRLQFPGERADHEQLAEDYLKRLIDLDYRLPHLGLGRTQSFLETMKADWVGSADKSQMLAVLDLNPRVMVKFVNKLALVREIFKDKKYPDGAIAKCLLLEVEARELFDAVMDLSDEDLAWLEKQDVPGKEKLGLGANGNGHRLDASEWARAVREAVRSEQWKETVASILNRLPSMAQSLSQMGLGTDKERTACWMAIGGSPIVEARRGFSANWRGMENG